MFRRTFYIFIFCFCVCNLAFAQFPIEGFELNPKGGVHPDLKEIQVTIGDGVKVYYETDSFPVKRSSKRIYKSRVFKLKKNTIFDFLVIDKNGEKHHFSQSYFVEREHTLPVLSIVSDPAHFFDSLTGIYVKGCCADTVDPYFGANFWKKWERIVNVEYYTENNQLAFNQPCGVRIFGGYSKSMPQKSLALFARKKYGDNRFRYPIFEGRDLKKYKNIVLRNGGGDMQGAHIRDVFATQLIKETGLLMQAYQPASVYINGQYWGKYNLREKINEHFIKAHFKYPKDSLIIMRHNGDHQHGPPGDYRKFIKTLKTKDLSKQKDLDFVHKHMDIDNYFTYNIAQVYFGNGDAGGNIRYYKSMRDTAKWRWIFYDLDHSLNVNSSNDYKHNSLIDFTTRKDEKWPNPPWSTFIIRKLFENDSLQHLYINRFLDILNTTFKTERAVNLLESIANEVEPEIDYHLKRWKILRKRYDKSLNDIKIFIENRPRKILEHLDERFDLGDNFTLTIDHDDLTKGSVKLNTLDLKKPFSGVYFKDHAIQLTAVPRFDYEFVKWEGINSSEQKTSVTTQSDTLIIKPIFKKKEYSALRGSLVISKIDAGKNKASKDWIELFNLSTDTLMLSDFRLRDDKDDRYFSLPSNKFLYPDSSFLLVENLEKFCNTYNCDSLPVVGSFDFGINKDSDWVRLYDKDDKLIDFIDLNNFKKTEDEGQRWIKKDYRIIKFLADNWTLSDDIPGVKNTYYYELLKQEARDEFNKQLIYFIGIGSGTLAIILFFIFFVRQYMNK